MTATLRLSLPRCVAMLCIALALVFAGGSLANGIDAIQHAGSASHEHSVMSEASILSDHALSHAPTSDDGDASDHLPGGHHHHGEANPGLPAFLAAAETDLVFADAPHFANPAAPHLGLRVAGPERPPKA